MSRFHTGPVVTTRPPADADQVPYTRGRSPRRPTTHANRKRLAAAPHCPTVPFFSSFLLQLALAPAPRDHTAEKKKGSGAGVGRKLKPSDGVLPSLSADLCLSAPAASQFVRLFRSTHPNNSPIPTATEREIPTVSSLACGLSLASFDLGSWVSSSSTLAGDLVGSSWVLRPAAASNSRFELLRLGGFAGREAGFPSNSALVPSNSGAFLRIRGGGVR